MNNLIDFLNYKQKIINEKIINSKVKIKEIKQKGGTNIDLQLSQLEKEIIKLIAINKILSNQKEKVLDFNLDEILKHLNDITNKYDELIKQAPNELDIKNKTNADRILNAMQLIESQLDNKQSDFLNIRFNNKLTFIQPPIDTASIDKINLEFIQKIEKNITDFDTKYKTESILSDDKYQTETKNLQTIINELKSKAASINKFQKEINDKTTNINVYTKISYKDADLSNGIFFDPSSSDINNIIETISINQISGLEKTISNSSTIISEAKKNSTQFVNIKNLVDPEFKVQSGGKIFTNSNNVETKIIKLLISSWEKKLLKTKHELCKKYYIINTALPKKNKEEYSKSEIQLGGGTWDTYYNKLIEYQSELESYKKNYNNLIQTANEFNLVYMQFFYHKLFIINYIKFILLKSNYLIYQNISRGTVSYYLSIVSNILDKLKNSKIITNNPTYNYFYTYHYFTLKILHEFLNFLYNNWKPASGTTSGTEIESGKNISRLQILNPTKVYPDNIKKGFFLFNLFKDILDQFKLTSCSPVSVFLRINDWGNQTQTKTTKFFVKNKINREQLDITNLKQCTGNDTTIINRFSNINFNEIFDPDGFKSNDTLALYMGIPNFLSKSQSIMMITYGYSGVGKTFTLFGNGNTGGVLQKALTSIQDMKAIYTRTYEIYGLALPYKSYWSGRDTSEYAHSIYTYTRDNNDLKVEEKKGDKIKTYLDDIKSNISDDKLGTYTKIDTNQITKFSDFVTNIDTERTNKGRIKKTINNPVSSRSIMVYEFKVKLTNDNVVRFVVMDLPGKEDILNSYVNVTNKTDQYCIKINDTYSNYNQQALRAAIYLNPILLAVFPVIAKELNNFAINKYSNNPTYKDFEVTTHKKKDNSLQVHKMISILNNNPIGYDDYTNENDIANFKKCILASENLRYMMENNLINDLIEFYNAYLIKNKDSCNKSYPSIAFEGFYINENILGLINTLNKRLNKKKPSNENPIKSIGNYFSTIMMKKDNKQEYSGKELVSIYNNNETRAQTYFIRGLLRDNLTNSNNVEYFFNNNKTILETSNKYETLPYLDQPINTWFENSYDFNKTYADNNPPIAQFMEAYFNKNSDNTDVINNFYLFYVVSNNNLDKCTNQIKLIADSEEFIKIIKDWV